jgi:predicted protein tyrosine phosphatase
MSEQERPIADSYWVLPGRLLAGEYPGAWSEEQARQKLGYLLDAGVTYFINLTEAGEYGLKPYSPLLPELEALRGMDVEHHRRPIRDMDTPTAGEMDSILDAIDKALASGKTVYVHCYGGIGRTGTVVGCYLARHGTPGEKALEQIARWREGTPDGWRASPETGEQRQMVLDWPVGDG